MFEWKVDSPDLPPVSLLAATTAGPSPRYLHHVRGPQQTVDEVKAGLNLGADLSADLSPGLSPQLEVGHDVRGWPGPADVLC